MSKSIDCFESISEADILREAQMLRARTIGNFIAKLFGTNEKTQPSFPAHAAPAE